MCLKGYLKFVHFVDFCKQLLCKLNICAHIFFLHKNFTFLTTFTGIDPNVV